MESGYKKFFVRLIFYLLSRPKVKKGEREWKNAK